MPATSGTRQEHLIISVRMHYNYSQLGNNQHRQAVSVNVFNDKAPLLITPLAYRLPPPRHSGGGAHSQAHPAYHINKGRFPWRALSEWTDSASSSASNPLRAALSMRRRQSHLRTDDGMTLTEPTLLPMTINKDGASTASAVKHEVLAVCLPCYNEEWHEMSGTLR